MTYRLAETMRWTVMEHTSSEYSSAVLVCIRTSLLGLEGGPNRTNAEEKSENQRGTEISHDRCYLNLGARLPSFIDWT